MLFKAKIQAPEDTIFTPDSVRGNLRRPIQVNPENKIGKIIDAEVIDEGTSVMLTIEIDDEDLPEEVITFYRNNERLHYFSSVETFNMIDNNEQLLKRSKNFESIWSRNYLGEHGD